MCTLWRAHSAVVGGCTRVVTFSLHGSSFCACYGLCDECYVSGYAGLILFGGTICIFGGIYRFFWLVAFVLMILQQCLVSG